MIAKFVELKIQVLSVTGIPRDVFYIHAGLLTFLIVQMIIRARIGDKSLWLSVLVLATLGQLCDLSYHVSNQLAFSPWQALHDIFNAMLWPTVLTFAVRLHLVRC